MQLTDRTLYRARASAGAVDQQSSSDAVQLTQRDSVDFPLDLNDRVLDVVHIDNLVQLSLIDDDFLVVLVILLSKQA